MIWRIKWKKWIMKWEVLFRVTISPEQLGCNTRKRPLFQARYAALLVKILFCQLSYSLKSLNGLIWGFLEGY